MRLRLRYVAALRDAMGRSEEDAEFHRPISDGHALIAAMAEREPEVDWFTSPALRLIVNNAIVTREQAINDGDTVAFCPPFSGG
ncbi:MoaD/ThiS family protein [Hyphobacterium marinum]|uniref:MoaD/ThiS family protein n=1 Tax=Hyphobacterium marinum TaxID=3116574 RepID=A0ABU7M1J8_9PROT|nr:MoaD/ThiS family protein [Hyphobacterium sp. Y6023]MEE2567686.1 MoaD/ThiS family protein [Hyphobacterium sp. Y6023]